MRPPERAQLVWRRAIVLAGSPDGGERFKVVLDLLRAAHHGPSTMMHALALGQAQQRATPSDVPTRNAVRLLTRTITWLGKRTEEGEVGGVGTSDAVAEPRLRPIRPGAVTKT